MQTGEELNLVADFRVGRQIVRFDVAAAQAFGRLALGGEVLGFAAFVHQTRGFESNRLPEFFVWHPFMRRYQAHRVGAGPYVNILSPGAAYGLAIR